MPDVEKNETQNNEAGRTVPKKGTSNRGFASMDAQKQREIASKGGKAAHASGHAHEFTSEEAREAGRKGGQAAHESGRAHEFTSEEAREAGRKGGQASHGGGRSQARRKQQNTAEMNPPPPMDHDSGSRGLHPQ